MNLCSHSEEHYRDQKIDLKQNDYNIVVVVVFVMAANLRLEGVFVTGDSAVNQMRLVAQADLISLIREKQMVRKCIRSLQ